MEAFGSDLGGFIERFEACDDLEGQLAMFYGKEEICNFVREHLEISTDTKNDELANRLKDEGNKLFLNGKDSAALSKYNEAMFQADKSSTTLSVLLANRSAVFYKLGKFELCVKDIRLALAWNYPSKMRYKLVDRRAKCYYQMGECEEMVKDVNTVKQIFNDNNDIPKDKSDKILRDLNKLIESKSKHKPVRNSVKTKTSCTKANQNFSGFSAAMEMHSSSERGRYMVAGRDVKVGEVVGAEDPVASLLLSRWADRLCNVCFRSAEEAPLPCLHCSEVRFCSEECWREGVEGSHRLVCGVKGDLGDLLRQVKGSDTSPDYYQLCVKVIGKHEVTELVEIMENVDNRKELNMAEVPVQKEADLRCLFNLVSNDQDRHLQTDFWIFLTVIYFLHILEQKNMFTDLTTDSPDNRLGLSRQQSKIGLLMLRTLRVIFHTIQFIQLPHSALWEKPVG